ncbi:hypothetical protein [Mycolicibacterium stellerae]|uniref:hypothetical protein n=1 Tax=Mycolicibacterium stellerae TaxID=2358193 RepID=UPI000F0B8BA2|nr:hypothetical protein [Mycolicibacterium stellerae]
MIEKLPERLRHLHVHQGHMVEMSDADLEAWHAGGQFFVPSATLTGSADTVRKWVTEMAQAGATEIMIEPSGPHIPRELDTFLSAVYGGGIADVTRCMSSSAAILTMMRRCRRCGDSSGRHVRRSP